MHGAVEGLVSHRHSAYRILQLCRTIGSGAFDWLRLIMLTTVVSMIVPVRVLFVLIGVHGIATLVVRSAEQGHLEAR